MDEGTEVGKADCPWDVDEIRDNDFVYRQVPHFQRVTNRGKKYPSESHFMLRPNEDSLSLNLERIIVSPSRNYKLLSLVYFNDKFLDYTAFKIFKFPVNFLKSLFKYKLLSHTPVFHGLPAPVGMPNNKSHVSLYCDSFDDGIRAELSDFCLNNYDESYCDFNVKLIRSEVEELRTRGNDTPFHKLWDFS